MVASTAQRIAESGIVATVRETDPETVIETADALHRDRVSTVEIAANTESVLNMIRDVSESFTVDEATIGAGIVLDAETMRATALAGAEFIVTPSFGEGVVETTNRYNVPSLAGIATSTEAVSVFGAGAGIMKVFPADTLGPRFTSALSGPLGHIPTVPIGGVGLDNMDESSDADVTTVGTGSSIVNTEAITYGEFGIIEVNARVFREVVEAARLEQKFDWLQRPR